MLNHRRCDASQAKQRRQIVTLPAITAKTTDKSTSRLASPGLQYDARHEHHGHQTVNSGDEVAAHMRPSAVAEKPGRLMASMLPPARFCTTKTEADSCPAEVGADGSLSRGREAVDIGNDRVHLFNGQSKLRHLIVHCHN